MSVEENIISVGEKLESSLANFGVTVDFGKSSDGKSTLDDMVEIIKTVSKREFLSVIPSSRFVVADESFVISVLLTDVNGVGVEGEEISLVGSDGSRTETHGAGSGTMSRSPIPSASPGRMRFFSVTRTVRSACRRNFMKTGTSSIGMISLTRRTRSRTVSPMSSSGPGATERVKHSH